MTDTFGMSDYRIEKVRQRVGLTLASGARLEGDIFLQAFARFRAGPEEPLDVLNEPAPFLPLLLQDGGLHLVHKAQIAVVATPLPETDELAEPGVIGMHVQVTMAHGHVLSGSIFPEVRADRPRLVDFLNNTPLRFLPMFSTDELLILNIAHIAHARPTA